MPPVSAPASLDLFFPGLLSRSSRYSSQYRSGVFRMGSLRSFLSLFSVSSLPPEGYNDRPAGCSLFFLPATSSSWYRLGACLLNIWRLPLWPLHPLSHVFPSYFPHFPYSLLTVTDFPRGILLSGQPFLAQLRLHLSSQKVFPEPNPWSYRIPSDPSVLHE